MENINCGKDNLEGKMPAGREANDQRIKRRITKDLIMPGS